MPTPVMFRKFKDNGEVIALFPTLIGDRDPATCESYMRVGQHGSASIALVYDTHPAHEAEYRSLLRELERIGYSDLRIYKRYQPRFTALRLDELRKA